MAQCLISFGANLGKPAQTIGQAAQQLRSLLADRLVSLSLSRMFRTPAVGGPAGQPPFVNAVAALEVRDCSAWDVWQAVREIEQSLGRVRQERWEARRIDLDVLLFDDQRIWTAQFKLPHPRMIMRRFILEPANDVASDWIEPVSGWTIAQLAQSLGKGAASIVLLGDPSSDQRLVDGAARTARAELVASHITSKPGTLATTAVQAQATYESIDQHQRWLSLMPLRLALDHTDHVSIRPQPQLTIVLAPHHDRPGAAWEDVHRETARHMDLCLSNGNPTRHRWPINGPRYLLSTDDAAWAEHEIVAALDAMDCPVEAIPQ